MRYLAQLIIPTLIFICVVAFATSRRRKQQQSGTQESSDLGSFIAILVVGAIAAVAIAWITQSLWAPA